MKGFCFVLFPPVIDCIWWLHYPDKEQQSGNLWFFLIFHSWSKNGCCCLRPRQPEVQKAQGHGSQVNPMQRTFLRRSTPSWHVHVTAHDPVRLPDWFYYAVRVELDIYLFQFKAYSTNKCPRNVRTSVIFFTSTTYWPKDSKSYKLLLGLCIAIHWGKTVCDTLRLYCSLLASIWILFN